MTRPLTWTRPAWTHSWLVPREAIPSFESNRSTVRRLEDMEAFCAILNLFTFKGGWDDPNCALRATLILLNNPSKLACSLLKGSLVDPRLRASNEHILIVRVPRAGGRPGCRLFFSILLEESALLEIVFVDDGGRFGGKLAPFLQQTFNIFPD